VKTGTSQAYRDNWTVGFTRDVTVGVWVGNFDRAPLRGSSGVTGAAPIFHSVMLAAQKRYGTSPIAPAPIAAQRICALSGGAATIACPAVIEESVPTPRAACSWHVMRLVNGQSQSAVEYPAEYRAWGGAQVAHSLQAKKKESAQSQLAIVSPPDGASYSLDPTLRRDYQTVRLRASVVRDVSSLTWRIDGRPYRRAGVAETVRWPLTRGAHRIEVTDDRGGRAVHAIEVR
jgi:penicillin-binding protein 1C